MFIRVHRWLIRALLTGLALLLAVLAAAADDASPAFTLWTAAGNERSGPLESIGKGWAVELGGTEPVRVAGSAVISLQRTRSPHPGRPRGSYLLLANGDVLPGRVIELSGEALRFQADLGALAELKLPLSSVALIWLAAPQGEARPDRFRRQLTAAKRSRDAVHLRNGDIIEGVLNSLDRTRLELEVDKKDVPVELGKVAVIALNTDLVRLPKLSGPHAWVVLTDGARLTLTSATADARTLRGQLAVGGSVELPVSSVAALDVLKGSAVYLSELKPRQYEFQPFLGEVKMPYRADANVHLGDLRIGHAVYDRGIGMHPASRLTYDLAGAYRRFEARVGLDGADDTAALRGAKVQVLVDGKPRLDRPIELVRHGVARRIRINVEGAKELTLVTDFLPRVGVSAADVDWAEARLIRAAK